MTIPARLDLTNPVARSSRRSSLVVGILLIIAMSLAISANGLAANSYRVSVPITLKPYDPDRWALLTANDYAAARAIDPSLPDPFGLPSDPVVDPAQIRQEAFVGPAAKPYRFVGASAQDRSRALYCLTAAIYYEAASESDDGQRGVAQVVLNRVRHPSFPGSVCGVVFQGSDRTTGCQFSFACDGSMARRPAAAAWARAARAAGTALAGKVDPAVGLATHYHTQAIWPRWGKSLVMTNIVGAHIFHRWRGRWGELAAFNQPYSGIEPTPGPYRPVALQLAGKSAAPAAVASVPFSVAASPSMPTAPQPDVPQRRVAAPPPAAPEPEYRDPSLAKSGQIKDKFSTSGEWIAR
jgi:spore germination cell wall hydrolase CwlJ-like protein